MAAKDWEGWLALGDPPEVMPREDLRPHIEGYSCWCHPVEFQGVIVHASADTRERYERGELRIN